MNFSLSGRYKQGSHWASQHQSQETNWKLKPAVIVQWQPLQLQATNINGSVKLLFWNKRGWEKWSSTPSVGISFLLLLHVNMALTPRKQPTSFYSSAFTFFTLLRATSVRALRIFLHVLLLFPVSFYYFFKFYFPAPKIPLLVLYWSWTSRVTWIHSCGKLERALCTVWNTS